MLTWGIGVTIRVSILRTLDKLLFIRDNIAGIILAEDGRLCSYVDLG